MPEFHFKKGPKPTGLSAVGHPYPHTTVLWQGKDVGTIAPPTHNALRPQEKWQLRLHKKDETQKSGWRWFVFKQQFDEEKDARAFLKARKDAVLALELVGLD